MSAQQAAARGDDRSGATRRFIQQRGRPSFQFLARSAPADFAIAPIEGCDVGAEHLIDHKDDVAAGNDRACSVSHGIRKRPQLDFPPKYAGRTV